MNLQQLIPLSKVYSSEEDFSDDLMGNLDALNVGMFEDVEREANVGPRRADIVAFGENGTLVVENQFNQADWDHWGRLEAYARLKKATVAVLVAEKFEELMITTCNLRNEDSEIDWYLIQAQANSHEELSFHHVARPARDIQAERKAGVEYSEFWAPIRREGPFKGMPVPVIHERFIMKRVRRVILALTLNNHKCYIQMSFEGDNRVERRNAIMELFPRSEYDYDYSESSKYVSVIFPVLDKGKEDREDWEEIREKLVAKGTDIYNKIKASDDV